MPEPFIHLHNHSEYSLLDGANRVKDLVKMAAEHEMPAVALTDHGVMHGAVEFSLACRDAGVKPIIGAELYTSGDRPRTGRDSRLDRENYHLLLLAQSEAGYRNLVKLTSLGHTEGFYYKPRIDRELLSRYSEGLIGTSACLGSEVAQALLSDRYEDAKRIAGEYAEILPGRFYLEMQDHGQPEDKVANTGLVRLAKELALPLVATNDIHYGRRADADPHDVILCIGTQSKVKDEKRLRYPSPEFYFKSQAEMQRLFADYPEALTNTGSIGEMCDFSIRTGEQILPHFAVPEGHTAETWFESLCWEGAKRRYPTITEACRKRIEYEMHVIEAKGYAAYFLIVADFVRWAHERRIPARCRGSAAGSVVAYALGISNIDPLEYNLLFERFFYMERISPPDIDLDFADYRRQDVIDYCREKYGPDHVAQIITFGTLGSRAAVRDAGRALDVPLPTVDQVAKLMPGHLPIGQAVKDIPELKRLYEVNGEVAAMLDAARSIEGLSRHSSIHAAAVVITPGPVTDYCPVQASDTGLVTQYDMHAVANIGLLKMDFLGLTMLTIVEGCLRLIEEGHDVDLDIDAIPKDDEKAFHLLQSGRTAGVFQMESDGIQQLCMEIRPDRIEDVISLVALYRPGPLQNGDTQRFIRRRHGLEPVTYPDPSLEGILKDTYGIFVFQDQILQAAMHVAGLSAKDADGILRALSKKKLDKIMAVQPVFIEGMRRNAGVPEERSRAIFATMASFASYGFNRNHSGAYAILTYQTAWLKANYPTEFMAALLTAVAGSSGKVAEYIGECRRMAIEVLPPDVNAASLDFSVDRTRPGTIRFGLCAIKGLGDGSIDAILQSRKAGPFRSLSDFCRRIDTGRCTKSSVELVVKAGGFDSLHPNRAQTLAALECRYAMAHRDRKARATGQVSLLGGLEDEDPVEAPMPEGPDFPLMQRLALEKETLGIYLSDHPLRQVAWRLAPYGVTEAVRLKDARDGAPVTAAGIVSGVRLHVTRTKQEEMAFVTLEDMTGVVDVTLFPRTWERSKADLLLDQIVVIRGRAAHRERVRQAEDGEETKVELVADEVHPVNTETGREAALHLDVSGASGWMMANVKTALKAHPGEQAVIVHRDGQQLTSAMRVAASEGLASAAGAVLGPGRVWIG